MNPTDVLLSNRARIVSYVAPIVAPIIGTIAVWLTTHVHLFSTFHIDQDSVAGTLTQAFVWGLTTAITYIAQHNWVKGHQVELKEAMRIWGEIQKTPIPKGAEVGSVTKIGEPE